MPEVIPLGTFTWHTELRSVRHRREYQEQNEKFRMSYTPPVILQREGKGWHNPQHSKHSADGGGGSGADGIVKTESGVTTIAFEGARVEVGDSKGSKNVKQDRSTKYVQYRVTMTDGGLTEEEIYVYDFVPPTYNIMQNSMMYATVSSPIAHLLVDYKNLRAAQIRRAHADAWNSQAHLVTTYQPHGTSSNVPEWKGFNYGAGDIPSL